MSGEQLSPDDIGIIPRCNRFGFDHDDDIDKYSTMIDNAYRLGLLAARIPVEEVPCEGVFLTLGIGYLRLAAAAAEIEGLNDSDRASLLRWCDLWSELTDSAGVQYRARKANIDLRELLEVLGSTPDAKEAP